MCGASESPILISTPAIATTVIIIVKSIIVGRLLEEVVEELDVGVEFFGRFP